jgi:hypothetical protein
MKEIMEKFEKFCRLSNGEYQNWHNKGMVCLIPKEYFIDAFDKDCKDLGMSEINNKNNNNPKKPWKDWLNMEQFGRPDVTFLCKVQEDDWLQLQEKSKSLTAHVRLMVTGNKYRKNKENWMQLPTLKMKEKALLELNGDIYYMLPGDNYKPGESLFYTEIHEGQLYGQYHAPRHTHINFEGSQNTLYNDIKKILVDKNISSTISDKGRIKIWCHTNEIPVDVKKKIYELMNKKYPDVRKGLFI